MGLSLHAASKEISLLDDGLHNVSRWMTWLPISLKNAAKCDKWYQLQNHPITESLNAKGAREKLSQVNPVHAVSLSVEQTSNRRNVLLRGALFDYKSLGRLEASTLWVARWLSGRISLGYLSQMGNNTQNTNNEQHFLRRQTLRPCALPCFVHRPECGRTTRRT